MKSENGQHSEVLEDILNVFVCGLQFLLLKRKPKGQTKHLWKIRHKCII